MARTYINRVFANVFLPTDFSKFAKVLMAGFATTRLVRNTTSLFVRTFSRPLASFAVKSLANRGVEWKSQLRLCHRRENSGSFCREWELSAPHSWPESNWFVPARRSRSAH